MLPKTYEPAATEEKWIKIWQEKGLFKPEIDKSKKPFTIVIPPPNITGALHMGHALNNTLQDIFIRYEKMNGKNSFWIPGTDHGGIATQNVMEKMLKAEGKTKEDLGREAFLKRMWDWYGECGGTILNQLKKIGCSIDFSKENIRFTMDEDRALSVFQAFKELWEKGLIYRGERMINWCPRCYTALSDIEVEYEEEKSYLWHIKYPLADGSGHLVVATTRPETMLGDTAVAVNPLDKRYKGLVGKKLKLPLTEREIPIVADEEVDASFGTGAVKVTPFHDPADFEISRRHKLEILQVISYEGRMENCPEKYTGKKALAVRKEIVEDLKQAGFLEKEEPYKHNVGKCYRCSNHIEPLVSEQWFVKTGPLAQQVIEKTRSGEFSLYPENWKNPFLLWLENIKDWCISRQIWWGHRIPAWYCKQCAKDGLFYDEQGQLKRVSLKGGLKPLISREKPAKCEICGGHDFIQDPDVLDTWFSSALWPMSVLGWPKKNPQLDYYYPTSLLVTGYEILYLWVARMAMSGMFHLGKLPFPKVYVHGIVRDKHGQKMSKSKGNVIDPLDMMKKYGTDSMRFSLIIQAIGGKDIPFSENSIIGGRNFVNKIYNVSRFIHLYASENRIYKPDYSSLDETDKWMLNRFNEVCSEYSRYMEQMMLPEALDRIYGFLWDEFCDWYLELSKPQLNGMDKDRKLGMIISVFSDSLKLLHPFMPFVTEELYASLSGHIEKPARFLCLEKLPSPRKEFSFPQARKNISNIMEIVKSVRSIRAQFSIPPNKKINALLTSENGGLKELMPLDSHIKTLAGIETLEIRPKAEKPKKTLGAVSGEFNIYIDIEGNVDVSKEKTRLNKEKEELSPLLEKWKQKAGDEAFIKNAPQSEVEKLRERITETEDRLKRIDGLLEDLNETFSN